MTVSRVFVSYSHKDKQYLDRMMVHLRPLIRDSGLSIWSDKEIKPGEKWQDKIGAVLEEADAAILLVSADFLASEFIANNELPTLLHKAEQGGTLILSVILKTCGFSRSQLEQFQAINDPEFPLAKLAEDAREDVWESLAAALVEKSAGSQSGSSKPDKSATTEGNSEVKKPARGLSRRDEEIWDFYRKELAEPNLVDRFHVYRHEMYLQLGIALDPLVVFAGHPWGPNLTWNMTRMMHRCGWEGPEQPKLIWLPPVFVAVPANEELRVMFDGIWVWHFKEEKERCWFASPYPLLGNFYEVPIPPEPEITF